MWFSQTPIVTQGRKVGEEERGVRTKKNEGRKNKHVQQENAAEREKKEDKQPIGKRRE